jgi:hypothetical protein
MTDGYDFRVRPFVFLLKVMKESGMFYRKTLLPVSLHFSLY